MIHYSQADASWSKLVAFAKWQYPDTLTPEQQEEKKGLIIRKEFCPEGTNMALYNQFVGQLNTLRAKHLDERKDYCKTLSATISILPGDTSTSAMLIRFS